MRYDTGWNPTNATGKATRSAPGTAQSNAWTAAASQAGSSSYCATGCCACKEDKSDDAERPADGINLSTVHAAKGLEFKVVFVCACEENLYLS